MCDSSNGGDGGAGLSIIHAACCMPYSYISLLSPYSLTVAHILPFTKFKPPLRPTGASTMSDRSTSAPQPATSIIPTDQYQLKLHTSLPSYLRIYLTVPTYYYLPTGGRKNSRQSLSVSFASKLKRSAWGPKVYLPPAHHQRSTSMRVNIRHAHAHAHTHAVPLPSVHA